MTVCNSRVRSVLCPVLQLSLASAWRTSREATVPSQRMKTHSTAFLGSEGTPGPISSGAQAHSQTSTVPFSPFNIAYYQSYFDVDTNTVLKRVGLSILPRPNFIAEACNGSIDLYGEFRRCWWQLRYRSFLDINDTCPRLVHHLNSYLVDHTILVQSRPAHYHQSTFTVNGPVRRLRLWPACSSTAMGRHQMARHR